MRPSPPFVLFVPSYGRGGSGEFVRAVALAEAVARRWPALRLEFLLPGGPGTRQDAPFPATCHDGPEDTKGGFDDEHLLRLRPDIAIFDSGCRSSTLRLCRRLGIRSVFISDRAGTCRKAFRLDWLRALDKHWHQREHLTAPAFTRSQTFRARFSSTRRLVFDTYLAEPPARDDDLPAELRSRLQQPFVLFAPGGGGYRIDGRPVSELFAEAAARVQAAHGIECLTLLGALYEGPVAGMSTLKQVSPGRFVALMRQARIVVCNGGHSLNQALACGAATVAAPLGGGDQPERIAAYAAAGLIRAAQPQVESLAAQVAALLDDDRRTAQRAQVARLAPVNGIPVMCDALAELLQDLPA
ncbi:MAG: hypothetical protein NVS9B10_27370 [Nevskia sp.]